jgi:hypothetical protein
MSQIGDLAERLGLVSPDRIGAIVHGAPVEAFCRIVEVTTSAIFADEKAAADNVSGAAVLASSSLRSDSGCRCWECRQPKLEALARYACLYADRLVIPVSLTAIQTDEEPARFALADLFYKLSVLRPLFDAGIAVFAPDIHCFCLNCGRNFDALCDEHDSASFDTYLERIGHDISVVYRPPTRRRSWYVELEGPTEYIPHGHLRMQPLGEYARTPRWAPKSFSRIGGRAGAEMTAAKIRKYRIGGTHFAQLARDAVIQQYSGVRYNAPYVTDSPVEARFLERVYPRDDATLSMRTLLEQMGHEIPLLMDLPIRRILRIRQSDYDHFLLYRNALQQVVRDHLHGDRQLSANAAREICSDVILPQVRKLKVDARERRRSAVRKALSGTVAVSAAVGLGLVSGMIRPDLERVFQLGGVALAGRVGEILSAIEKYPAEVRNHNMYFLLKLVAEAD